MIRIEDNNTYCKKEFIEIYPKLSEKVIDKNLELLLKEENILIFPHDFENINDLEHNHKIIETINDKLKIQNIIGFIGYKDEKLEIHSRFSQNEDDYFLHYLLQKTLNINIVNLDTTFSMDEQIYQLWIYLFPKYLNTALRKGIFKEYRYFEYNDTNVKGSIDISRHIKFNVPFTGKIAYSTREFTYDNNLMQLIRHTIEFIRSSIKSGGVILNSSETTKQNISAVIQATPSYNLGNKRKVIIENKTNPIRHAYYTEYRKLQNLCLMILTYKWHDIGKKNDNIYGILFDVSWLWEEYTNTLLKEDFIHSCNKKREHGLSLYKKTLENHNNRTVFPDFYSKDHFIVADAKYKKLDSSINRHDLYQIIAYSYILKAKVAGVLYPTSSLTTLDRIGELKGYGVEIFKQSLQIPQNISNYKVFVSEIEKSEKLFKENFKKLIINKSD